MNKIKKYVPTFCSGVDPEEYYFNTAEELFTTPLLVNKYNYFNNTFYGVFFKRYEIFDFYGQYYLSLFYSEDGVEKKSIVGILDSLEGIENIEIKHA